MNTHIHEHHHELGLISLLQQLWRGRYTLLAAMVFTLTLASDWLIFAPKKWTSSAIITRAEPGDMTAYLEAIRAGQNGLWFPDTRQNALVRLFDDVVENISSSAMDIGSPFSIKPMTKWANDAFIVTCTASDASQARRKLERLLAQVSQSAREDAFATANNLLRARRSTLEKSLAIKAATAREQNNQRLVTLRNALAVASAVNLQQAVPTQTITHNEALFLLGAPALRTMIDNAKHWPLPYSESYYQLSEELQSVKDMQLRDSDDFSAFRYIQTPDLPLRRDGAGAALILVLALLLGAIVGSAWVLVRDGLRASHIRYR